MYRRSVEVGSAPLLGGPEQTMSPTAAILTVLGDAAAEPIGSAARPATKIRAATAARIRRTRMGRIVPQRARRCQSEPSWQDSSKGSELELGPGSLLIAVALLGEG